MAESVQAVFPGLESAGKPQTSCTGAFLWTLPGISTGLNVASRVKDEEQCR
jgi:hypothetical protein